MRLCIDCKHYLPGNTTAKNDFAKCARTASRKVSLVDGKEVIEEGRYCSTERQEYLTLDYMCGLSAKHFEPKEQAP